jgi:arginine deiminase
MAEMTDLIGNVQADAPADWLTAKDIVMHQPGEEIFLGLVHPNAALFEQSFSLDGAIREHENFVRLPRDSGARVFKLTDILLAGTVDGNGHVI